MMQKGDKKANLQRVLEIDVILDGREKLPQTVQQLPQIGLGLAFARVRPKEKGQALAGDGALGRKNALALYHRLFFWQMA